MIRLCAFADEISTDLDDQVDVLLDEGIRAIELRSMWNVNVLDLDDQQVESIGRQLRDAGIEIACIGSPIGKVRISSAAAEPDRLRRAVEIAERSGAQLIRVFSFYPDSDSSTEGDFEARVLDAMEPLVHLARESGITLVHENEKDIFGDTIARCGRLLERFSDGGLKAAFDPANFIQCDQTPYPDAYDALHPWIAHVHVKDALAEGTVVPAGDGVARWPALMQRLRDDGYDGFLSLEPHLAQAGTLGGFSGADRFRHATRALKRMLDDMQWQYA